MGKISDYANVLKSKLTDLFVVYQRDNGELETKNATLEQLGDAICGEQVHATLETDDQTIIGGINENKDKVGDLSSLTTTDKSSLVGAVNEVNAKGYNDLSGRPIRTVVLNSTNPATIQGQVNAGYATFIIVGFVASLGGVVIAVQMTGGNLTKTIDLLTGNTFTSTHLTFSTSSNRLVMNSDVAQDTTLMIFG